MEWWVANASFSLSAVHCQLVYTVEKAKRLEAKWGLMQAAMEMATGRQETERERDRKKRQTERHKELLSLKRRESGNSE